MGDGVSEIEYEILALSRHINAAMGRSTRGRDRLEESAYTILNLLDRGGPMSIGGLGEILGLDASTLNRQTAAMIRSGLVERRSDEKGGLARRFFITGHGQAALMADRRASQGTLAQTLGEWTGEQKAQLLDALRSLNTEIETRYRAPWPRTGGR